MLGGAGSPGGDELLTVTVIRDEQGYGMKVSGDNPVYVQSVKEHGAAWRAGLRAGDRIIRVDGVPVHQHTHQQVVLMIRANPSTVLTVHQNTQRHKTPITAPLPVNPEKQRQVEYTKVNTFRMMLDNEQKYIVDLRNELAKVPDVRKQALLDSAEKRCLKLQREIDSIAAAQPDSTHSPATPKLARNKSTAEKPTGSPPPVQSSGFLSGLPRSLSNLTGQSIRNLRQRQKTQENQPPLQRQSSDDSGRKHNIRHNNTVPMVPTTCLDNVTPPPLPPRTIRNPLTPNSPLNPLAKPKPGSSISPSHKYYPRYGHKEKPVSPMHQSVPAPQYSSKDRMNQFRRSSHSLDGELEGPQPNSIAMQMSYPLVNVPPPPLQMDNRGAVPVMHVRSQSSPEHLDHGMARTFSPEDKCVWPAPPGTPPPPYAHNTQPCADPQRAIISMEEDDSPASDTSTYSGLFSNLRSVRESKARTAVLLNWLLGERRCASANLLLLITDGYRSACGVTNATLRRWAYEIHSTFLIPNAVLQLNGVDENMANEIEHVLCNEHDKDELLRNVFRKPRQKAKEELTQQLTEFQVKRQVGLGALYAPEDSVIEKCDVDKAQELVVVERLMSARLAAAAAAPPAAPPQQAALAALVTAALLLHCRPAAVTAAAGGSKASFLQRDKLYKQRLKQLHKQNPQPFVVRGHHLQLQALTAAAHCHACSHVIWGLAPQAAVCSDCNLRVHRTCARTIEEPCCLDTEHHNNRISRFMERIHNNQPSVDASDKKSRKSASNTHFLNMERSFRKMEDEPAADLTTNNNDKESDESLYESADNHSDAITSDDYGPRLNTPTISKESLKVVVTDEEVDIKHKKGHRKTISLSNPLEMIRNLDPGYLDKKNNMRKSRESLWSEEEVETRKNSKKEKANRKSLSDETKRKSQKTASTMSLNLFRWKKPNVKPVEAVEEAVDGIKKTSNEELLSYTKFFIEEEQRHSAICQNVRQNIETDTEDDIPTPKPHETRRKLSRQTSRSKSKVRGKSQSVKVNTLRKSHSGTLKKAKAKKKAAVKTPLATRSRQASMVEMTPMVKKKKRSFDASKQAGWLFGSGKGEARREGSSEEPSAPDAEAETTEAKEPTDKDNNKRPAPSVSRGVNRAESCRERDAPRRGKHRNASDPNRLTAHNHHDLEPGAATAPSGSSSSSSLSSRSNESNTVAAEQQASQSDLSEEDEPLAPQWKDSLPPHLLDTLLLSAKLRKRQEVIHELIVSEGSHVKWLKVLGGVFLKPLESQPTLLPPEELKALFPNLPNVKERHSKLYADLRSVKNETKDHVIQIRPVADAVLGTLGETGYAACLSRFCRNQRMALNALGERRRKHKELAQFLSSREQLQVCGRLQLRDLLPCVWQRLTKYQLLLENILATVEDSDSETEEDVAQLKLALTTAKEVLHSVDTAIRTAENQHRLRSIQSKLEVRAAGSEWHELRSLDLNTKTLLKEGELMLRCDGSKKCSVLALMLEDVLVLLLREGDKFVLKPISQTNVNGGLLTPMIHWNKVLFRPNAAVRNAFFLVNKKEMQMYELSCSTNAEYATWVKYIEEVPSELQTGHQQQRSTDDSGTNVSRNPSDASSKSSSTAPVEDAEEETRREEVEREEEERPSEPSVEVQGEGEVERAEEERHIPRRPTVGRISTHGRALTAPLEPPPAVAPAPRPETATVVCTNTGETARSLTHSHTAPLEPPPAVAPAPRPETATVVCTNTGETARSLTHSHTAPLEPPPAVAPAPRPETATVVCTNTGETARSLTHSLTAPLEPPPAVAPAPRPETATVVCTNTGETARSLTHSLTAPLEPPPAVAPAPRPETATVVCTNTGETARSLTHSLTAPLEPPPAVAPAPRPETATVVCTNTGETARSLTHSLTAPLEPPPAVAPAPRPETATVVCTDTGETARSLTHSLTAPLEPPPAVTPAPRPETATVVCTNTGETARSLTHSLTAPLEPPPAVAPAPRPETATVVCTNTERLRRLDGVIAAALRAKSAIVAELVGTTPEALPHLADMALADTLGELDLSNAGTIPRSLARSVSREGEETEDMHQLLLAAYTQANQIVTALSGALTVSESALVAARSGVCDTCRHKSSPRARPAAPAPAPDLSRDLSYDMLPDIERHDDSRTEEMPALAPDSASALAARLVPAAAGLQASLSRVLASLPAAAAAAARARSERCAGVEASDAARARLRCSVPEYETPVEHHLPREGVDQTIQDQPSNGG